MKIPGVAASVCRRFHDCFTLKAFFPAPQNYPTITVPINMQEQVHMIKFTEPLASISIFHKGRNLS